MACENCVSLSALRSEFSEVKTDIKLIIRLISMLLVDSNSKIAEAEEMSVQNNEPNSILDQPNSGSAVVIEANAYGGQQEASAGEFGCNFDPAVASDCRSEVGVDAATMINVKVEETSELETPSGAYESGLTYSLVSQCNGVAAYAPSDFGSTTAHTSGIDVPWCIANGSGDRPRKRSRRMNLTGEMVCVGEDPNVLLPVEHFIDIVNRSNSATKLLQRLVAATIPDYANYTFEIVKDLAACPGARSRDGLKSLREHPAFAACVNQTIKQFGAFEFDTKLQQCLYKKCFDSRQRKKFKTQCAAAFADYDVPTAAGAELFQPSANDDSVSTQEQNVFTARSVFVVPHHAAVV